MRSAAFAALIIDVSLPIAVLSLALLPFPTSDGLYTINRPTKLRDFKQIGSLLVEVFDETERTSLASESTTAAMKSVANNFLWNVAGRLASREQIAIRYRKTSARMYDKKYELLLAKTKREDVVGMVEMGLSPVPVAEPPRPSSSNTIGPETQVRVATVGVLAVSPTERQRGIGRALMGVCEELASLWGEDSIYAAVEPANHAAVGFFESMGFESCCAGLAKIKVQERLRTEERPHLLLKKNLDGRKKTPSLHC